MTTLIPSFIANVAGAGDGKGLEAAESKQGPVVRQGLSTPNNSGVVTVLPAWPPYATEGRDFALENISTERRLQQEKSAVKTGPEPTP